MVWTMKLSRKPSRKTCVTSNYFVVPALGRLELGDPLRVSRLTSRRASSIQSSSIRGMDPMSGRDPWKDHIE